MKRTGLFLLLGLGVGALTHVAYYRLHQSSDDDAPGNELAWMKTELRLTDAQFARITALHRASRPQLRALAVQVEQQQKELAAFETMRRTTDRVDFIAFARFVEERRQVSRACFDSTRQLVQSAAAVMTPAQRERYLGLVRGAAGSPGSPVLPN